MRKDFLLFLSFLVDAGYIVSFRVTKDKIFITVMNVTPEEWETYDYHTISLNEREQEDEEESEENEE